MSLAKLRLTPYYSKLAKFQASEEGGIRLEDVTDADARTVKQICHHLDLQVERKDGAILVTKPGHEFFDALDVAAPAAGDRGGLSEYVARGDLVGAAKLAERGTVSQTNLFTALLALPQGAEPEEGCRLLVAVSMATHHILSILVLLLTDVLGVGADCTTNPGAAECTADRAESSLLQAQSRHFPAGEPSATRGSNSSHFGSKPNILFLLVDDWGFGDVDMCPDDMPYEDCPLKPQSRGRAEVLHTPRMKELATHGMIFTNYYSPRAICTPSRAALLSGRDPVRAAFVDPLVQLLGSPSLRGGFPLSEHTAAEYLKELGYTTGFSGKWHLGYTNGVDETYYTPPNQGYDETFFFVEGSNGETCEKGAMNPPGDNNIYHCCAFDHISDGHGNVVEQPIRWENVTSRHLREGLMFIEKHANDKNPWFYDHHFLHVHIPWVPSRMFVSSPSLKYWVDMVAEVDWAVGVFMDKLKELRLDQNTLVILTSDNGPYLEAASSYCPQNCLVQVPSAAKAGVASTHGCTPCDADTVSLPGPLSGGKGQTWEGGQRVPALFVWPGKIPPGTVNPVVASSLDFLPTAVALAGGTPKKDVALDGRDLSFTLFIKPDPKAAPEGNFVYWCGVYPMAVRMGRYKIWFKSQDWLETKDSPTPKNLCAQTGQCCVGSPTRMCPCQWATHYDPPMVIDLVSNTYEDPEQRLDPNSTKTKSIVAKAIKFRRRKVKSVMEDRGLPHKGISTDKMLKLLEQSPNLMQIDFCVDVNGLHVPKDVYWCNAFAGSPEMGQCKLVPPECQQLQFGQNHTFFPYENCSIYTYQSATCQKRLPCGKQEGYKGPYEYVRPTGADWNSTPPGEWEQCGCFTHGNNSYFLEDDFAESLCKWQDDVVAEMAAKGYPTINYCRFSACARNSTDNDKVCASIAKYGLNDVPTGELWNAPYPDDQDNPAIMYPNSEAGIAAEAQEA